MGRLRAMDQDIPKREKMGRVGNALRTCLWKGKEVNICLLLSLVYKRAKISKLLCQRGFSLLFSISMSTRKELFA